MGQRQIADYKARRCRIQRLRDVKFCYGWIEGIDPRTVTARIASSISMESEDECVFEAYGDSEVALFSAHFVSENLAAPGGDSQELDQRSMEFRICPPIAFKPADQSSRKLANGLKAVVLEPIKGDVLVHDVSESGLGIICEHQLKTNSSVEITISHEGRDIGVVGTVRYSRLETGDKNLFRTGVEVRGLGRLDLARWRSFVAEL